MTQGEVRFEDMSFGLRQRPDARPVIDRLNLTIRPGEKIGLIGRSGAGKVHALVNLLLRFHDVQSGRIVIDGRDIARVTQDSLRRHIGMVTQDTSLLHRSMRDNIRTAAPMPARPTCTRPPSVPKPPTSSPPSPTCKGAAPATTPPCGRARREALGRPAPARGHCIA